MGTVLETVGLLERLALFVARLGDKMIPIKAGMAIYMPLPVVLASYLMKNLL